jgi:membrane protease YdiL (CAAX protease family)
MRYWNSEIMIVPKQSPTRRLRTISFLVVIILVVPKVWAQEEKQEVDHKSPAAAAGLSFLFPGAGHFYLNDWGEACGLMGAGVAGLTAVILAGQDGWPEGGDSIGKDPTMLLSMMWLQNTWTYGIFSAYQDARLLMGDQGYRYPVPREDLLDLLIAPFDPDTFFEPEVALGLIGALGAGILVSYLVEGHLTSDAGILFSRDRIDFMGERMHTALGTALGELYYLGLFTPVGIGEEAFFRGYVQSGLSEWMGKTGGWVTASILFGGTHATNALLMDAGDQRTRYLAVGLPFLTLLGGYFGWVYMHNNFSLKEPVALHFWYNLIVSSISFALNPEDQPFVLRFGMPF